MTKIAILQSNYIPWRGYFDIIKQVDEFIILDDVQYTHSDWRNRNRIVTKEGAKWLTIPVNKANRTSKRICEVERSDKNWPSEHWKKIQISYAEAEYFTEISELLKPLYEHAETIFKLSEINYLFIIKLCEFLEIKTKISHSTDYFLLKELDDFDKDQRIINLCKAAKAGAYLSGPAARNYMDMDNYSESRIDVHFVDYSNYKEYPQLHGHEYDGTVSIIDLLFNTGVNAKDYF